MTQGTPTHDAKQSQHPSATTIDAPAATPRRWLPKWISLPLRWSLKTLRFVFLLLVITWTVLAMYWSNLPWPWARLAMAVAFAAFAVWSLWIVRPPNRKKWRWALAGTFTAFVIWWILIPPSHDRPWRREVAVMPRAIFEGDRVRLVNYRHFTFRSREDFDVHYEERVIDLSRVASVDFLLSFWNIGPVGHTFVSFNFDDGSRPVCISIETRPEIGEGFDPISSMFKQVELIYVVGDERDLIRVRTDYRDEEVFLYRIRATPEGVQQLFRIYLDRVNELYDRPEWYHLLKNNCTINIIRYSRRAGVPHARFELKHLLNGLIDRYLFGLGILDTSMEFDELRRISNITELARAIGDTVDFSALIRERLPIPK